MTDRPTSRRLVARAGLAAAAASPVLAAPALAQGSPEIRWRMTSAFPKVFDTLFGTAELVAQRVALMTDNRFRIQVFPAGEIVPPFNVVDAVQNGTVECGHGPNYYAIGKDPTFAFDTALPFGMTFRQHNAWIYHGGGQQLIRDFMKTYNTITFLAGNTGTQMGGFFRKEIRTVADMQGLKFRIAGLGGQVLSRMGIAPQQLPVGEVYAALERGTIDAVEFVGPYDDLRLGVVKVAPFYYTPGFWEGGAALSLNVNLEQWAKLPPAYQAAIESACAHANADMMAKYDANNAAALRTLISQGAQLRAFPREVMAEAFKHANTIFDEIAGRNAAFKTIYEPWKKFRDDTFQWLRVGDNSYENFVFTAAQTVR